MGVNPCFVMIMGFISLLFSLGAGFFVVVKLLITIEHRLTALESRFISLGKEKNVILLRDSRWYREKRKKK